MHCDFCGKEKYRKCSTCQNSVCHTCQYKDHCKHFCSYCQGKDLNFFDFFMQKICRSCLKRKLKAKEAILYYDCQKKIQFETIKQDIQRYFDLKVAKASIFVNKLEISPQKQSQDVCFRDFKIQMELLLGRQTLQTWKGKTVLVISERIRGYLLEDLVKVSKSEYTQIIISDISGEQAFLLSQYKEKNEILEILIKCGQEGKILMNQHSLERIFTGINFKDSMRGLLEEKIINCADFTYTNEVQRVYWINYKSLSKDLLFSTLRNLQKIGIEPFISRIIQIFQNIFDMQIEREQILRQAENSSYYIRDSINNFQQEETCISTKEKLSSLQVKTQYYQLSYQKSKKLARKMYSANSLKSIFLMSLYFKFCSVKAINNLRVGVLYLILQFFKHPKMIPELQTPSNQSQVLPSPTKNIQLIIKSIQSILQQKPYLNFPNLQSNLKNLFHPHPLDFSQFGSSSLQAFMRSQPQLQDLEILLDKCVICYNYLKDLKVSFQCSHFFHYDCLKDFSISCLNKKKDVSCPTCRYKPTAFEIEEQLGITEQEQQRIRRLYNSSTFQNNRRIQNSEFLNPNIIDFGLLPQSLLPSLNQMFPDTNNFDQITNNLINFDRIHQGLQEQKEHRNQLIIKCPDTDCDTWSNIDRNRKFNCPNCHKIFCIDCWEQCRFCMCPKKPLRILNCPVCENRIKTVTDKKYVSCEHCTSRVCVACGKIKEDKCYCVII